MSIYFVLTVKCWLEQKDGKIWFLPLETQAWPHCYRRKNYNEHRGAKKTDSSRSLELALKFCKREEIFQIQKEILQNCGEAGPKETIKETSVSQEQTRWNAWWGQGRMWLLSTPTKVFVNLRWTSVSTSSASYYSRCGLCIFLFSSRCSPARHYILILHLWKVKQEEVEHLADVTSPWVWGRDRAGSSPSRAWKLNRSSAATVLQPWLDFGQREWGERIFQRELMGLNRGTAVENQKCILEVWFSWSVGS